MFKSEASSWKSVRGSNSLLLIGFQFSAPKAVDTHYKQQARRRRATYSCQSDRSRRADVNLITVHVKISLNAMAVLFGVDYARNQFEAGICRLLLLIVACVIG
ncbi:hypothetical protein KCU98_g75, partial [Aureobasidium melanogenum]